METNQRQQTTKEIIITIRLWTAACLISMGFDLMEGSWKRHILIVYIASGIVWIICEILYHRGGKSISQQKNDLKIALEFFYDVYPVRTTRKRRDKFTKMVQSNACRKIINTHEKGYEMEIFLDSDQGDIYEIRDVRCVMPPVAFMSNIYIERQGNKVKAILTYQDVRQKVQKTIEHQWEDDHIRIIGAS